MALAIQIHVVPLVEELVEMDLVAMVCVLMAPAARSGAGGTYNRQGAVTSRYHFSP